ncbi:hypothetical protein CDL12_30246 [Handroanthus impetiginosus]|uniref:MAR-binding filament-like protein 1-1 n=1 Tax=Handroanthus impetiginosus TaxID=429701 RepID=A0A2G9FW47_9LAMI|nr:hypothetical protein CDL12_30246 [Handroanthus impetiginosus]
MQQSLGESLSENSFFPLHNALGLLVSGLLAAFFASTKKTKATSDATIKSMNIKLKEKEDAITSLEKKIETELLNEREVRIKVLAKANEDQQSLVNRLNLASDTITDLESELRKEKTLVEDLTTQVNDLEVSLHEAQYQKIELQEQLKEKQDSLSVLQEKINLLSSEIEDKENNLRFLDSELARGERELNDLRTLYLRSLDQIVSLCSAIIQLKGSVIKKDEELELKSEAVHLLNRELTSLFVKKDEWSKKLDAVLEEYDHFKSSTEKKYISDAKILGEREAKIHLLEEQLKFSLDEVRKNEALASDLIRERDELKEMLNTELNNRDEASDATRLLKQLRNLCSLLEAEVSKVQAQFNETRELLQKELDEGKVNLEILAGKLSSTNELLRESNKQLQITSQELAAAEQKCDSLGKELIDSNRKTETAILDLEEDQKVTSSLKKDLEVLEAQVSKDQEARKSLESSLAEVSKTCNEMSRNSLNLTRELELANARILRLEYEKDELYKSIDEEKQVSQEVNGNLEDAYDLVMRLGKERESLEKRGKNLEEELAYAKGEILSLRSQINSSRTLVNDQDQEKVDMEGKVVGPTRKSTRRRKVNTRQEDA